MFRSPGSGDSRKQQRTRLTHRGWAAAPTLLLGAALAAVAFGAGGGSELSRTAITELLLMLAGGVVVATALLWAGRGPLHGATSLGLFVLLAVVTALSITWSVVPELAYIEAGRTLAYLAAFAAGIAGARLAPRAGPLVVKSILIGALAAVAYALIARVWPGSLAENELSNRIGQPFQYWNAVGTTAALAVPGLLWLGARREGSAWGRALGYPGMGLAVLAILLTQSRGALAAAAMAAVAWLCLVPLRLRSLAVLLAGGLSGGAVAAWALSKDAFSVAGRPLSVKEEVAGEFGVLLLLMTLLLIGAGYAVQVALERGIVPPRLRDRAGIAAAVCVGVLAILSLGAVALSDRGLAGTLSDRADELTSETDTAPTQGAGRFAAASSTRGKYWTEARLVFEDRPAVGTGAGTFRAARLRHRTDPSITAHAHGYVPQTLADLGLVGLTVTMLLLLAWLVAAARATSLYPRRPAGRAERPEWSTDRCALVALVLAATAFGLQSAIDWTWFVPGPAVMALVAAGFVAGRGPVGAPAPADEPRRDLTDPSPGRVLAAAGVLLAALLCAWAIWQPEAGERATGKALTFLDRGDLESALLEVDQARAANPLSAEPLLLEASIETQGGLEEEARETLEMAVLEFPGDPDTWYRLAAFQLGTLERPDLAIETVQGALYLDPESIPARQLYLEARASARQQAQEAAAAP